MKLKCIGGKCDGQLVDVDDNYHQHDFIRVMGTPAESYLHGPTILDDLQADITSQIHTYKIEILKYYGDTVEKFKCLIPHDANLWKTIIEKLES